jgi:hypothetical protein
MKSKDETQLAVICEKVSRIEIDVRDIKDKLEKDYVTKEEFTPVKTIVYTMIGVILLAVIGALIKLVILQ